MILIGQYDSPFVRRVGIALNLYNMAFEHRPWSVFGDAEKLAAFNPLKRVPTLVLDDGEVLIDSVAILDALDEMAGADRALIPAQGPARRRQLKVCALAVGLADKAVSLVYERVVHERGTAVWIDRCQGQIGGVLGVLEQARAALTTPWWFGPSPGHADIAVAVALRFLRDAHPDTFSLANWPTLEAHSAQCENMAAFQAVQQAFHVTPPN